AALRVGDLAPGEQALGVHLDAAERAELPAQGLERSAVDEEDLEALGIRIDPDGAVPIRGIDVPEPGVGGLQHVPVGVDDSSGWLASHEETDTARRPSPRQGGDDISSVAGHAAEQLTRSTAPRRPVLYLPGR